MNTLKTILSGLAVGGAMTIPGVSGGSAAMILGIYDDLITAVSRAFNPSSRLDPEKRRLVLETAAKYGFTPNRMASRLSMREIKIGIIIYA